MYAGRYARSNPDRDGLARWLPALAAPLLTAAMMLGCTGGLHRAGQQQVSLSGSFGHAIKGDVLWPYGLGRADNAGVTLGYHYFTADRWALGVAVTPYRSFNQLGVDSEAAELQLGARYYFAEFDAGGLPVGLFAEMWGGMLTANHPTPPAGSHTNFTQNTGLGFEVQLSEHISWISGYHLRHMSNCYVFGEDNPSQNDHFVFTGLAFAW